MPLPFLLLAASAPIPTTCATSKDAVALVSRASVKWLLLGETRHGTNELPLSVVELVCAAASARRPVTIGVEFAARNQPASDAFMRSDGGLKATAALLAAPAWDPEWADGKSSEAMLRLLDWLREKHKQHIVTRVIAFDADVVKDPAQRDRKMALRLKNHAPVGRTIFIVLTGSHHARTRINTEDMMGYQPLGALLPRDRTVTIRVVGSGGRSWSCSANGCGEQEAYQTGLARRQLSLKLAIDASYDGQYDIGMDVTPSPPARQGRQPIK